MLKKFPYLLLLPGFTVIVTFLLYPWYISFIMSFYTNSPILGISMKPVGLKNYVEVLTDPLFMIAIKNTLFFAVPSLMLEFILGLGIALLYNRELRGSRIFRTILLLPMMMAPVVAALMFRLILHTDYGILNYFLELLGMRKIPWLSAPQYSIPSLIIVEVWNNTPFVAFILLAGLQAIPQSQLEAAKIDGANVFQTFRYITWPWLLPLVVIAMLFRTVFILRTTDFVFILFSSITGVGNSALLLGPYLYYYTYRVWDLGFSSAISYILLIITLAITSIYIRYLYREMKF
jgi:multiple sugar transport system permease protein